VRGLGERRGLRESEGIRRMRGSLEKERRPREREEARKKGGG
jgi:hypothetical protein